MPVSFGALIKTHVKKVAAKLNARTHRRVRRLQRELAAQRREIRRLSRRMDAVLVRRGRPPAGSTVTGSQIRAARKRAGLSRLAFAKKLGVSPGSVYLWESGRATPRGSSVQRLGLIRSKRATATQRTSIAARKGMVTRRRRRKVGSTKRRNSVRSNRPN